MVIGFESFREHFKGYEDCYVIIGGTACDILMGEANIEFRATKDVDLVMLIEHRFELFAEVFWKYVKAGGYKYGWKGSEQIHFYRFTGPQGNNYPAMIEIFSRRPEYQLEHPEIHLTPLHVSEEVSSLSAIILDNDYYQLMLDGRRTLDGISVLDTAYLILFKAKAWIDLARRKQSGMHVNDRDLRKHKNDVFRLFSIVDPATRITLPERVGDEMRGFINAMMDLDADMEKLGMSGFSKNDIMNELYVIFGLQEV